MSLTSCAANVSAIGHRGQSGSLRRASLAALLVAVALTGGLYALAPDPAHAGSSAKCKTVKKAGKYTVKKIKVTRGVSCNDARRVVKRWVQRDFDQNTAIQRSSSYWFCTWHRRDPKSVDTGTADCESGASDEIQFLVRKR